MYERWPGIIKSLYQPPDSGARTFLRLVGWMEARLWNSEVWCVFVLQTLTRTYWVISLVICLEGTQDNESQACKYGLDQLKLKGYKHHLRFHPGPIRQVSDLRVNKEIKRPW